MAFQHVWCVCDGQQHIPSSIHHIRRQEAEVGHLEGRRGGGGRHVEAWWRRQDKVRAWQDAG